MRNRSRRSKHCSRCRLTVTVSRRYRDAKSRSEKPAVNATDTNFDAARRDALTIEVPPALIRTWRLADGRYALDEQLYGDVRGELVVEGGTGKFRVQLDALESFVFRVGDGPFRAEAR